MLWEYIKQNMLQHQDKRLRENGYSLTYEEVVIIAETFAERLDDECYAILCDSELYAGIAVLACIAANVTAVPLSHRYGEKHIKQIVQHIRPPKIITCANNQLSISDIDTGQYQAPEEMAQFIMCTSGTTGAPKGIMLSKTNVLSTLWGIKDYFNITSKDAILIPRTLYHCPVLVGEFLYSLCRGLDISFYSGKFVPSQIFSQISENKTTVMGLTPTLALTLGKCVKNQNLIKSLKNIVISGECLTSFDANRLLSYYPNCNIYHVYGLTEAGPRVCYLPPKCFSAHRDKVGVPLKSISLKIIDEQGHELGTNQAGQLVATGPNIMLGYYNDKAATDRVIKVCENSKRWLHTGDIAMCDEKGYYKILGRMDDLIIKAGMNIYPSEIENLLKQDSRVQGVVVYSVDKNNFTKIAIDIRGDFSDTSQVRQLCRKVLPDYALPAIIRLNQEISQNSSGKISRALKH